MNNKLVWVGVRESDIRNTGSLFYRSVTIHGSGKNGNTSMEHSLGKRFNHNSEMTEYDSFFQKELLDIINKDTNARFVFYDNIDGASFCQAIQDKTICKNDRELLASIDDKLSLKSWAKAYAELLPSKTLCANQLSLEQITEDFPSANQIVVQKSGSYGGNGTYLIQTDSLIDIDAFDIDPNERIIVTEYQENSIPVNIHCVIYPDDYLLFPPSVQLISCEHQRLEYIGSDYTTYQKLSMSQHTSLIDYAGRICKALRERGYRGVCGIDFIIVDDKCFFMEINGRFQASSSLLNSHLRTQGYPSLHEYHIDAFTHKKRSLLPPPDNASGSMLVYYADESLDVFSRLQWFREVLRNQEVFFVIDDSLNPLNPIENGSYLFQLRSEKNISCITFQNTVRLHPNLSVTSFEITDSDDYENLMKLKIMLLNRGVSISDSAWSAMCNGNDIDWEEFDAVTLRLFHRVWVTAPSFEAWYGLSPLRIEYHAETNEYFLYFYQHPLFPVELMPSDPLSYSTTKNGHYLSDIVYLNPDRLRVYHRNGCALQDNGTGCRFCDLFGCKRSFSLQDIMEAVSYYFENEKVHHFLIGGGSELSEKQCSHIVTLAKYIRDRTGKHIYLMSQPIRDKELLKQFKENGITEVAFNIEVFNRDIAQVIMPGKSRHSLRYYEESLSNAVEIWGSSGEVRSAVILGFDSLADFKNGIQGLCDIGAAPILSVFRPCPETPMADFFPPSESEIYLFYQEAARICSRHHIQIGPSCSACQNNTVALDY